MYTLRGPGAPALLASLASLGVILVYTRSYGLCRVFASSSYVHVGSVHSDSNSVLPEA